MSDIYGIVATVLRDVNKELGTKEQMDKQFANVANEFGDVDYNRYAEAIIKVSTAISNNVLVETLEKIEKGKAIDRKTCE